MDPEQFVAALGCLPQQVREALLSMCVPQRFCLDLTAVAHSLGMNSRFQLGRAFRRAGLAAPRTVRAWLHLVWLIARARRTGSAVTRTALGVGHDPSVYFRLAKRLTGRRWRELLAWPTERLLEAFLVGVRQGAKTGRTGASHFAPAWTMWPPRPPAPASPDPLPGTAAGRAGRKVRPAPGGRRGCPVPRSSHDPAPPADGPAAPCSAGGR
jgi:hypothetical protein